MFTGNRTSRHPSGRNMKDEYYPPETGFRTPETELQDVTSGRNMKMSTATPETGFCTPETELQDFTAGRDEYCCTRNRYLYTGNRNSRRHFRHKFEISTNTLKTGFCTSETELQYVTS
jgi:hypothetical protein